MSAWGDTSAEMSNWMSQQVIALTFADRFKKNSVLARMMQQATPQAVCSDAPILKIEVSNSVQAESAVAGSSIGAGGGGLVIEPALTLYTQGVPIDLADEYLLQIDVADAKDRVTLGNHLEGWRNKAYDMIEFAFSGCIPNYPGCLGYMTGYDSSTGVCTMASTTPDIMFDKFIVPRARFDGVVMSTGVTYAVNASLTGYVKSVDKAAKTFVLTTDRLLTSTTYPASTTFTGQGTTNGLYFYGLHAAAPGLYPFGLNTLFQYHSSAAVTLFGQSGYTYSAYQPAYVAGATSGLVTKDLNKLIARMYLTNPEDNVLMFDQIVYANYEETVGNDRTVIIPTDRPQANIFDIGLKVAGKFMPIEVNPYWNGNGQVMSIPMDEVMLYYSKGNRYQDANTGAITPGWAMRFPMLQPSTTYYNSVNELIMRYNFGIKGNRRKAGVISGLETDYL